MSYVLVDRRGNEERLKAEPREYGEFALSPDGTRIAVNVYADPTEVWTYDVERDIWTRLTFDPTEEERPIWSPDGRHVAFGPSLSWKAVDGTGEIEPLREGSSQQFPNAFSPDGTLLVFEDRKSGDLGLLSLSGSASRPFSWARSMWREMPRSHPMAASWPTSRTSRAGSRST